MKFVIIEQSSGKNLENEGKHLIRHLFTQRTFLVLTTLITLTLSIFSFGTQAAGKDYSGTWFEIEVILFKHVGDKSKLQEVFPTSNKIDTPASFIDMISPIFGVYSSHFKNQLDVCPQFLNLPKKAFSANQFKFKEQFTALINQQYNRTLTDVIFQHGIAENKPTPDYLNATHYPEYVSFTPHTIPSTNCRVPEAFFDEYKQENPDFTYNETPPESIPATLVGEEDLTTDQPYFISNESLQLHDVVEQLDKSWGFKPLLHLGWRQITENASNAIPLKLYAGNNLMQQHVKALKAYKVKVQKELNKQLIAEQTKQFNEQFNRPVTDIQDEQNVNSNIDESIVSSNSSEDVKSPIGWLNFGKDTEKNKAELAIIEQENIERQRLETQIKSVLEEAKLLALDPQLSFENQLNETENTPSELVTPINENNDVVTEETAEETEIALEDIPLIKPDKPTQDWTIEGFLKVEVEHFLHVTADFNVINMSVNEQTRKQQKSVEPVTFKSIRLQQNKRVRSKEIHYLDHPFMGIIIQIRRHDQIAPEENTETLTEMGNINTQAATETLIDKTPSNATNN